MAKFVIADGFAEKFESFLAGAQKVYDDYLERNGYKFREVLVARPGRKNVKIVRCSVDEDGNPAKGGSAHCFVDMTNGNVLKTASWSTPAKHARGNIFADDNGLGCMGPHGAASLR